MLRMSTVDGLDVWCCCDDINEKRYLNQIPLFVLVIQLGLEPRTPTLKVLCSTS